MKIIILAVAVAIGLGFVANFALNREQEPAYEAFATGRARVGDPGANLVGKAWDGNVKVEPRS